MITSSLPLSVGEFGHNDTEVTDANPNERVTCDPSYLFVSSSSGKPPTHSTDEDGTEHLILPPLPPKFWG